MSPEAEPLIPDYAARCTANLVPELVKTLTGAPAAGWMPGVVNGASQVVLLVLDGLGWEQLQEHAALAPTLVAFEGGPITTVAPTTTAAGLTSIVTGRPPAAHGIAGYRLLVNGDVLDVLKWRNSSGDARASVVPEEFQRHVAFAANEVPVVTRSHFIGSGFTSAHMQGAKLIGYSAASSLPVEVWRLAKAGEPFIYAYYDGIDTIAHAHGMGEHYDAELYTVDRLVRDMAAGLPEGCALVITSDHGQVQVGGRNLDLDGDIVERCWQFSGEGRFRWLHAHEGAYFDVLNMCKERYGELAWVKTRHELSDEGWFGGPIDDRVASRLGDIALVAAAPVAFNDPSHDRERQMQCRHGSLTSAEVRVPLLASRR